MKDREPCGTEPWHGTLNGYTRKKCRGDRCAANWNAYRASQRKYTKDAQLPKSRKRVLSDAEIDRLRKMIGFTPGSPA